MLNLRQILKAAVFTAALGLFVSSCGISPVVIEPTISTGNISADQLSGKTVYVKVNDSRSSKDVGVVTVGDTTTNLRAYKPVATIVAESIARTFNKYGMTVVDSIGDSDSQMFVTIKDLEYVYPREDVAESAMAIRVSVAGETHTHQNIVSAWSRYEISDPGMFDVRRGLNDVSSRALENALTEAKLISVLAGSE